MGLEEQEKSWEDLEKKDIKEVDKFTTLPITVEEWKKLVERVNALECAVYTGGK